MGNSQWGVYIINDNKVSPWRKAWNKDRLGFCSDFVQDKHYLQLGWNSFDFYQLSYIMGYMPNGK